MIGYVIVNFAFSHTITTELYNTHYTLRGCVQSVTPS